MKRITKGRNKPTFKLSTTQGTPSVPYINNSWGEPQGTTAGTFDAPILIGDVTYVDGNDETPFPSVNEQGLQVSAALEIKSEVGAFLLPRMPTENYQPDTNNSDKPPKSTFISTPGMMLFDVKTNQYMVSGIDHNTQLPTFFPLIDASGNLDINGLDIKSKLHEGAEVIVHDTTEGLETDFVTKYPDVGMKIVDDGEKIEIDMQAADGSVRTLQATVNGITEELSAADNTYSKLTVDANGIEKTVTTADENFIDFKASAENGISTTINAADGTVKTLKVDANGIESTVTTTDNNIVTFKADATDGIQKKVTAADDSFTKVETDAGKISVEISNGKDDLEEASNIKIKEEQDESKLFLRLTGVKTNLVTKIEVFSTPGLGSWTYPQGASGSVAGGVEITCIGGGGAGGQSGAPGSKTDDVLICGGGGAAGDVVVTSEHIDTLISSYASNGSIQFFIGEGIYPGNTPGTTNNTYFGSDTFCYALYGASGVFTNNENQQLLTINGAPGGSNLGSAVYAGSYGGYAIPGGSGGPGVYVDTSSGSGTYLNWNVGFGGSNLYSSGGAIQVAGTATQSPGVSGVGFGAGGSGGYASTNTSNSGAGGPGNSGAVILKYLFEAPEQDS